MTSHNNPDSCWSVLPGDQIDQDVEVHNMVYHHEQPLCRPSRPAYAIDFGALAAAAKSEESTPSSTLEQLPLEMRWMIYHKVLPAGRRLWCRPVTISNRLQFEIYPADAGPIETSWSIAYPGGWTRHGRDFWQCVRFDRIPVCKDAVALMQTSLSIFMDVLSECTITFDNIGHLAAFANCLKTLDKEGIHLPVRSIEVISYTGRKLYSWMNGSLPSDPAGLVMAHARQEESMWEGHVDALKRACAEIPWINSLKLAIVSMAPYARAPFLNEQAIRKSVEAIGHGVPRFTVELYHETPMECEDPVKSSSDDKP